MNINDRAIGDHASAMGKVLLDLVGPDYRKEEHHDLRERFTEICQAGLEAFAIYSNRMQQRLKPGKN